MDDNLPIAIVMDKAHEAVQLAYDKSTDPDVKDKLTYTLGLLETALAFVAPIDVPAEKFTAKLKSGFRNLL